MQAPARHTAPPSSERTLRLKQFTMHVNVGDLFSSALAAWRFGAPIEVIDNAPCEAANLILLGSILQWADENSIICGAGLIKAERRLTSRPREVISVRGPLTAEALGRQGVDCGALYGDPGLLAPRLFPVGADGGSGVAVVPHYVDLDHPWLEEAKRQGAAIVSPAQQLESFFDQLQRADVVLSSSLHGLVFAHAYGKPALWLELSGKVLGGGFKFRDYYASLGVEPDHALVAAQTSVDALSRSARRHDVAAVQAQIEAALDIAADRLGFG